MLHILHTEIPTMGVGVPSTIRVAGNTLERKENRDLCQGVLRESYDEVAREYINITRIDPISKRPRRSRIAPKRRTNGIRPAAKHEKSIILLEHYRDLYRPGITIGR